MARSRKLKLNRADFSAMGAVVKKAWVGAVSIEGSYPAGDGVRFVPLPEPRNMIIVGPDDPAWTPPHRTQASWFPGAFVYLEPPATATPEVVAAVRAQFVDPAAVRVKQERAPEPAAARCADPEVPPEHGVRDRVMAEIAAMCAGDPSLAPLRERIRKAAESSLSGAGL